MKYFFYLLLALFLILPQTIFSQSIMVSGFQVEMLPLSIAFPTTKVIGFKAYNGQVIDLNFLNTNTNNNILTISQVIKDGILELNTGDILYQRELEFALTPVGGEFTGWSQINPLGRAPHNPK